MMEIQEGNKLIAEFMNLKVITMGENTRHYAALPEPLLIVPVGRENWLLYHKSWDWLMMTVEKIEALGIYFEITKNTVRLVGRVDFEETWFEYVWRDYPKESSKIETTWEAVIEFIKWYNCPLDQKATYFK